VIVICTELKTNGLEKKKGTGTGITGSMPQVTW
jgi:hypothetical protein